ncbi:MAG: nitroreductase family deazaflavin-dependent oxidoreductase [Chloroflexota bacterium]
MKDDDRSIAEDLTDWGKVVLLETVGRTTGRPVSAAVGFVEDQDGSLLIAAGSDVADWALNLRVNPDCRATIGERVATYEATEVDGPDRSRAITQLILKYGTPAEKLGRGPVFRLREAP